MARNSLIEVGDWREHWAVGAAMPHRPLPLIWHNEPDFVRDDRHEHLVRLGRAKD